MLRSQPDVAPVVRSGSLIIRQLSVLLKGESIYRTMAALLQHEVCQFDPCVSNSSCATVFVDPNAAVCSTGFGVCQPHGADAEPDLADLVRALRTEKVPLFPAYFCVFASIASCLGLIFLLMQVAQIEPCEPSWARSVCGVVQFLVSQLLTLICNLR